MATYNKFNSFVDYVSDGVINIGTNTLVVALTNTAPVATNTVLADITEIAYTNLSARTLTVASHAQTSGTLKVVVNDLVLTATGAVGPFRYVVVYDDTPTVPADPLICWFDYGSAVTMANGETFTVDFDNTNGLFQLG